MFANKIIFSLVCGFGLLSCNAKFRLTIENMSEGHLPEVAVRSCGGNSKIRTIYRDIGIGNKIMKEIDLECSDKIEFSVRQKDGVSIVIGACDISGGSSAMTVSIRSTRNKILSCGP